MVNDIQMVDVVSSQIAKIGHDAETSTLAVRFHPPKKAEQGTLGPLYHYSDVSEEEHGLLMTAESVGSHFGKFIKPVKACTAIPEPLEPEDHSGDCCPCGDPECNRPFGHPELGGEGGGE